MALASVIGRVLARRATNEGAISTIENLNQRVNAWWGMVIIFFVSWLLGPNATVVLFGFISLFALREFITLTPTTLGDHNALLLEPLPEIAAKRLEDVLTDARRWSSLRAGGLMSISKLSWESAFSIVRQRIRGN